MHPKRMLVPLLILAALAVTTHFPTPSEPLVKRSHEPVATTGHFLNFLFKDSSGTYMSHEPKNEAELARVRPDATPFLVNPVWRQDFAAYRKGGMSFREALRLSLEEAVIAPGEKKDARGRRWDGGGYYVYALFLDMVNS